MSWRATSLAIGLGLLACNHSSALTDGGTDGGLAAGTIVDAGRYTLTVLGPASPDLSCNPHATAADAGLQFTDVTSQWGIGADGGFPAQGTGIDAVDLDGDGYPDVIMFNEFNVFSKGPGQSGQPQLSEGREPIPKVVNGSLQNLSDGGLAFAVTVLMNRPNPNGPGRIFVDATESSGLFQIRDGTAGFFRSASIATIGDVNNDGTPDVFTAPWFPPLDAGNEDTAEIMLNDGTGHFSFSPPSDPALMAWDWYPQGITMTDFDNDGQLDIYEAFWHNWNSTFFGANQQLYRGNGDGTFASVTQMLGLDLFNYDGAFGTLPPAALDAWLADANSRPVIGVTACDLNGDGYPELLADTYGQAWNTLYQNNGSGTGFTEVGRDAGFAGDNDRDYHDNQYFICYCLNNHSSTPDCKDAGPLVSNFPSCKGIDNWQPDVSEAAAELNGNNFTSTCRDMFGSGKNDVYTSRINHWWAGQSIDRSTLQVNESGPYDGGAINLVIVPNATDGLVVPHTQAELDQGWNEGLLGSAAVDMDNDGRPDLLVSAAGYPYQRTLLFLQQGQQGASQTFAEQAVPLGLTFRCADGFAVADFDRDGDLDVLFGASLTCSDTGYTTPFVQLYTSNASRFTHWLEIRLKGDGTTTNSMGIGAQVTLTVNGASQMQELQSTYGHQAIGNDIGVLFWGLGNCASVDSIRVRWPNRALSVDTWSNVPADHFIELRQADPTLYAINLP